MFNLVSKDMQAQYERRSQVVDAVYNFATKQEQNKLDAIKTQQAQTFQTQQNNLNFAQTIAAQAIQNDQAGVGASIMKLMQDPTSPTFQQDVANYAKQIQTTQSTPTSGGYRFTPTQLNTGAATAGLPLQAFQSLDGEVQNFYVNSKPLVALFNEALAGITNGTATPEEVKANIATLDVPDAVKQHLTAQVNATAAPTKQLSGSENFALGVYNTINKWLGI